MGDTKIYPPCIRLIGAFSRYPDALEWLWKTVESHWGAIHLKSPQFQFKESAYYTKSMGSDLLKQFAICSLHYDPADLYSDKLTSNRWEEEFAQTVTVPEQRPLNVDPGYIALTKLVLASTKNREHRIYLREGIYAEVTLAYRNQQWKGMEWTYPDYQREDFQAFFSEARSYLLSHR